MNWHKILIVEDNEKILDIIKVPLESLGFTCHCVTNQKDAIDALRKDTFGGVFLDYAIPARPGAMVSIEFGKNCLEQIRQIKSASELPVIVMTALTDQGFENVRELIALGATSFWAKGTEKGLSICSVARDSIIKHWENRGLETVGNKSDLKSFTGGKLVVFPNSHVELDGVEITRTKHGIAIYELMVKRQKGENLDGRTIAEKRSDLFDDQHAVAQCIGRMRKHAQRAFQRKGIRCGLLEIIGENNGTHGYRFTDRIKYNPTDVHSFVQPGVHPGGQVDKSEDLDEIKVRRIRILSELATGPLLKSELAKRTGLHEKMIQREVAALREAGRIVLDGNLYRLKENPN